MTTRSKRRPATKPAKAIKNAGPQPRQTKRDRLIGMLKSPGGSDVATLSAEFGWLPHTTRAALTGLRKAGFTIERQPAPEGERTATYRITAGPAAISGS